PHASGGNGAGHQPGRASVLPVARLSRRAGRAELPFRLRRRCLRVFVSKRRRCSVSEVKVYDEPDPAVALYWRYEGQDKVYMILYSGSVCSHYDNPVKPMPGRWLPVELPAFPVREKAPIRLCMATVDGKRRML